MAKGKLSTHVLDIYNGKPAAGVNIQLLLVEGKSKLEIKNSLTNLDGRTDSPLLLGEEVVNACYELVFHIGDYFRKLGIESSFLDQVPIRFHTQSGENYHVPLLCSPWAYSSYRGS